MSDTTTDTGLDRLAGRPDLQEMAKQMRGVAYDVAHPGADWHMLLWVDVETTGLHPDRDDLLEVGMRVTPLDRPWDEYGWLSVVIREPNIVGRINRDTLPALRMHLANGLLDQVLNTIQPQEASHPSVQIGDLHKLLDCFLTELDLGDHKLHPAGTNVDFDLRFLQAHMSGRHWALLQRRLSHRKFDLSTIRMLDQLSGLDPYAHQAHTTTHRVDDCLDRDIDQWTTWIRTRGHHLLTTTTQETTE